TTDKNSETTTTPAAWQQPQQEQRLLSLLNREDRMDLACEAAKAGVAAAERDFAHPPAAVWRYTGRKTPRSRSAERRVGDGRYLDHVHRWAEAAAEDSS